MTRITGTLHENQYILFIVSHKVLLRMTNVQTKVVKKIKNKVLCSTAFFPENRAVYNVEKYRRAGGATDDNMAHTHRIPDC